MLPVAVMGPVMGNDVSGANHIVQRMLSGGMPRFPHLFIPIVDVRDVAQAHILAMTNPDAAGQRFLLSNGPAIEMKDIGNTIKGRLGAAAGKVPTRTIPNLVVRIGAVFVPEFRSIAPDLGYAKKTSNEKARMVLGWTPRDPAVAIVDAAESMVGKDLAGS
jgi:nucleoside-diphosphate-sugar epimerase